MPTISQENKKTEVMGVGQAAKYLGVTPARIRSLIKRKLIKPKYIIDHDSHADHYFTHDYLNEWRRTHGKWIDNYYVRSEVR